MLLSRNPERRLAKLEMQLEDREEEMGLLKKDIKRLRERVEKKKLADQAKLEAEEAEQPEPENENASDEHSHQNLTGSI